MSCGFVSTQALIIIMYFLAGTLTLKVPEAGFLLNFINEIKFMLNEKKNNVLCVEKCSHEEVRLVNI